MRYSLLYALGMFIIGFSAIAQSETEKKESNLLYLTNHTLDLKGAGIASELVPVDGRYYAIIQTRMGSLSFFSDKEEISMLDYLPKNAGIFSIDASTSLTDLKPIIFQLGGAMVSIKPEWKLSKRLFNNNIPDWAWVTETEIHVWLHYFSDMDHSSALQKIKAAGYTVLQENSEESLIAVSVKPENIDQLTALPFIYHVQEKEDPGEPENYTARTNHRVNTLQSSYPGAPAYDGSGVVVGHGDDGAIGPHIDYTGRLSQSASASTGDHGDHVAGTIFGAGNLDPRGRGMAPGADLYYQTYPDNLNDADQNYDNLNVRVTNSSYSNGCNAGYTIFTRRMDQDLIDNPNLLHIFSAGNNGSNDCSYGAGPGWGNVTGGHKIAKNVVAVANLSSTDDLENSSSRGPASDGRIKPDVAAVGKNVNSTTNPNLYVPKTGTSMAAPGVAGTVAVLYEAYRDNNSNQDAPSGLLKAILLNSSDDLGNPGPDFLFGYGRVNARKAYEIIEDQSYLTDSISQNGNKNFLVTVPANTSKLKVMLYWSDPPASIVASRALVNDLDMQVTVAGNPFQPWVLDPTPNITNLGNNAVRARDSLNNVEQVTVLNPPSGDVTVNVSAFNIPIGTQKFYVVYYFEKDEPILTYPLGGEGFEPSESELIRWDAPEGTGTFTLDYSTDGGLNWTVISSSIPADRRYFNWNVPNTISSNCLIRIGRGGKFSVSPASFTIIDRPANIAFAKICPDTLKLTWDIVNGATGYIIYRLGQKYMDSIGFSQTTFYDVPISNLNKQEWYSVAAVVNGGEGMRANAVQRTRTSLLNCILANDLDVLKLISPPAGPFPNCYSFSNVPISVRLENDGVNPVFNFPVSYRLNSGSVVTNTVTDTIAPGAALDYTFSGSGISFNSNTTYSLDVWSNLGVDNNRFNDTISSTLTTYNSTTVNFPYSNNFELFNTCNTSSDCGQTNCTLAGGWFNADNGTSDDIDFRTNTGNTPSSGTGPSVDHNPGTSSGKYIYLEASGGCDSSSAILMSPCINLAGATSPLLEFWYHMNGTDMGKLTLDIYDGTEWDLNVIPVLSGSQGNSWQNKVINLLPYVGKTITLRFTGKTGNGFSSDIALDDISLYENLQSPAANFNQDNSITCIDGIVNFTDVSTNIPTSWEWTIQPSTYTFVKGTGNTSQDISVQFNAIGTYQVTLVASNNFGSDTLRIVQAVTVDPGKALPIFEDFENPGFPPTDWTIDNPDNQSAWFEATVTGAFGGTTKAAAFDNFNSGANGANDGLITLNIDLRTITDPILFFDVAYAQASSTTNDSLVIDFSTDCGETFSRTTYEKGGAGLSTAPLHATLFSPASSSEWRRDTLDLASYTGNNVKLRFRNYSNAGNVLYLDNIQIVSGSAVAPLALFGSSVDSFACKNDLITFSDSTTGGTPTSIMWDFGQNAVPSTATTAGPHQIRFVRTGTQTITLTVSNAGGFSQHTMQLEIGEKPVSAFNTTVVNAQTIQFNDLSLHNPQEWKWKFGDGDSSSIQSPVHTYTSGGTYNVFLEVSNDCGTTNRTQSITVSGIGLEEKLGLSSMILYPNPSSGIFTLKYSSSTGQEMNLSVSNLAGKLIYTQEVEARSGTNETSLDLSAFAKGVYMIRIETETGVETLRALKR